MRIRLLGTGTPTPSLVRASSGYMIEIGKDVILFDHGPGSHNRLLEAGKRAVDVTHVFFSHLHYDHCLDYIRLLMTRWDQSDGTLPDLKVYGPAPLARMTQQIVGEDGVFGPDLTARTQWQPSTDTFKWRGGVLPRPWPKPQVTELRSGSVVKGEGWTVTCRSVQHAQPYLTCYGFRLDSDEGSFAYSGDTGPCAGIDKLAEGVDVLVHMCQYISGTAPSKAYAKGNTGHLELAQLGARVGVKNLVVSHILAQMDVPGVRERLICEMSEIYKGNLFWGEDLMEIPVGDPRPAAMK